MAVKPYFVAGIDPGKSGGYAIWDRRSKKLITAGPLVFDEPDKLLRAFDYYTVQEILIERAQASSGQGVSTAMEYGRAFGRTEAACIISGADIYYVGPAWWKGKLNVSANKELAVARAHELIPNLGEFVTLKKHDGIAEAAMIGMILTDKALTDAVMANNEKREKRKKRKRVSYRI